MEIRAPSTPALQLTLQSAPALVNAWRAGQLLEATVVRADAQRGSVVLQLAGGEVEARSEVALRPGMRLQLDPQLQEGVWVLRLRQDPSAPPAVAAALRQALPREAPLAPLFQAVERLLQQPPAMLPPELLAKARALRDAQPTPQRLSQGDALRQALRDSGMLLEAQLAEDGAPPSPADLKARLLQLLLTLSTPPRAQAGPERPLTPARDTGMPAPAAPAPPARTAEHRAPRDAGMPPPDDGSDLLPQLLRQAEGALARLQLHQLRALPEAPEPQWVFELPVRTERGTEGVTLKFEREQESEGKAESGAPGWRVTVDLSQTEYGALRAVITWRGGVLATRFFAERAATADLFRQHLPRLAASLTAAGIKVAAIEAHTGIPAAPAPAYPGLLSERA